MSGPLQRWKKRLAFLLEQEAVVSDPAQRFTLREQIEEAQDKIRELEGTKDIGPGLVLDLGRLPIPGPHFVGRAPRARPPRRRLGRPAHPRPHPRRLRRRRQVGAGRPLAGPHGGRRLARSRAGARLVVLQPGKRRTEHLRRAVHRPCPPLLRRSRPQGRLPPRPRRPPRLSNKEGALLLVLDGIEPLQYPPGRPEIEGRLKDPGLAALLKGLAAGNPGLCVVTTRERIADLAGSPSTAPQIPLEELEPGSGPGPAPPARRRRPGSEMVAAAKEFQRHALTLTLLGNFLRRAHGGDIRKRREIDLHRADEKQGGHAFRVIAAYARWLGEGPELAILSPPRPLRPARGSRRPESPARRATDPGAHGNSGGPFWKRTGISPPPPCETTACWRRPIRGSRRPSMPIPWCAPASRKSSRATAPKPGRKATAASTSTCAKQRRTSPDTLEAMQPLYAAVVHGCRAGRQQEVMDEVYWRRILRGTRSSVGRSSGPSARS